MPDYFEQPVAEDLFNSSDETCMYNFDRVWAQNGIRIDSSTFQDRLDSNGKFRDSSFPADNTSLYWRDQEGTSQFGGQVRTYQ